MAYAVSSSFRPALGQSHTVAVRVRVRSSTGVFTTLDTDGGSVSVDIDRTVRRDCSSINVLNPSGSLIPTSATSLLSPLSGAELWIDRGITYASGSTEYVPLGRFTWTETTMTYTDSGIMLTLDGLQDRSLKVIQATYWRPITVSTSTAIETVITNILKQAYPSIPGTKLFPETGATISSRTFGVEGDSDPWTDAVSLARDYGYRLFFSADGVVTMRETGAPLPTATVTYGASYPLVTNIERSWSSDNTYSGVIATGAGTNMLQPFRSVAWDETVTSPTYYRGPFGRRVRIYSSSAINTQALADQTARTQLQKTLGVAERVTWSQIPDPSLDVGDVVTLVYPDLSLNRSYRIDRIEIPLAASDLMTVTARERRLL